MPIEATDAIALMGYDLTKFEDINAFKAQVESDWVKTSDAHMNKDIAGRIFAKQNNTLRSALAKVGNDFGIDGVDFNALDPIEGIKVLSESVAATKAEWEKAKGDGSTSAEVAELKRQYDEAKKAGAAIKASLDATTNEFTEYKSAIAKKEETAKLEGIRSRGMKSIPFASTVSDLAKVGFDAMLRKELVINYDDEGKEYVTDADGSRIKDPAKANAFLTYEQAARAIADREKLTEETPAPQPVRREISTLQPTNSTQPKTNEPVRTVRKLATR